MDVPSGSCESSKFKNKKVGKSYFGQSKLTFLYLLNVNVIGKLLVASYWYTSISKYTA